MFVLQFKDGKMSKDLMLMSGLNETMDQSPIAKCVPLYSMCLGMDSDVLVRALDY